MLRLQALLPHVEIRPSVDQINLRDCCDVPHDLLEYTKKEGIKLMPHMDEDNPLPNGTLQGVLEELQINERVVQTQWVVKYTAVVKERGIVENKGYVTLQTNLMQIYCVRTSRVIFISVVKDRNLRESLSCSWYTNCECNP